MPVMLDRTVAPSFAKVQYSVFPQAKKHILPSGIPLFYLQAGTPQVIKFEIVFQSGIWYERQKSQSWCCAKMLREGTSQLNANQVSEKFESLGAFVEISPNFDDVALAVYCLKRNFTEVLNHLNDLLNDSVFPEKELGILKGNRMDQIKLNDKQDDLYASKKIRASLFGVDYPYGIGLKPQDIAAVDRDAVLDYFENQFFNAPQLYLSGGIGADEIKAIEDCITIKSKATSKMAAKSFERKTEDIFVDRPDSLQSAIRIAWHIPQKSDSDYFKYQITNCVLGGYFGARLMKNIREEKGFTYGVSSYPIHLEHRSFGVLSTEVRAENTTASIHEIWKEVRKLQNEKISHDELETVINYMAGSFLGSISTPFQLMEKFKAIHRFDLGYDYYRSFFDALNRITPADILIAARDHFKKEEACSAIVGRMD